MYLCTIQQKQSNMEKLSQRFYEQIKSRIEGEIEGYMPEDYQLDIRNTARGTRGRGTSTLEVEVELPEGYVAEVTLRVYTSVYNDRGDYFTPPECSGTHSWEVTHLDIWDAEGELAEELNDLGYMEGEYEW
mgnify:FL=1